MNLKYIFGFTSILCLVALLLVYKESNKKQERLESDYIRLNNEFSLLYNNMGIQFDSEDRAIDLSKKVVNSFGDSLTFRELFADSDYNLVFRFSNLHCMACVDQELANLNSLAKSKIDINIIGLSDFNQLGSFKNFVKIKNLNFSAYNLINSLEEIPVESLSIPYVFLIHSNSAVLNNVFIPSKDIPENSIRYYSTIMERFNH